MKTILIIITVLIAMITFSIVANGTGFTATCEPDSVHTYRNATDPNGKITPGEWRTDENLLNPSPWIFVFDDDHTLMLNDEEIVPLSWDGKHMLALEHKTTSNGTSAWIFAINLEIERLVASQVNSYDVFGSGVKTRSVSFLCTFE